MSRQLKKKLNKRKRKYLIKSTLSQMSIFRMVVCLKMFNNPESKAMNTMTKKIRSIVLNFHIPAPQSFHLPMTIETTISHSTKLKTISVVLKTIIMLKNQWARMSFFNNKSKLIFTYLISRIIKRLMAKEMTMSP